MADPQPVQLGQVIRRFRLASGMSQEQLAERSGLSARSVSDLERGLRSGTRPETLRMLAEALSLSEEERGALLLAARPELRDRHSTDKATSSPRTSWPELRTQLIGREREVDEVVQNLTDRARIVTLTGPGGVGKTSVALEAGRRFSQASGSDSCFVDLSPITNPDFVVPTIALALGIAEPRERSIVDALVLALQQRRVLLLLDNFEQVIAAAPIVGELVERAAELHVLVTSREALRIHRECEIVIDPLSLPHSSDDIDRLKATASIGLFVAAATRADPAFVLDGENVSAVAGICQRLDGLPLAIELAASRVRYFPPALLLERMERRLPVLTGGRRDLPARQQTLRNAIAWSYELLTPDEQALFRRIGAFPGGATLDALDAFSGVAGSANLDLISGLASLVDKHLVREKISTTGTPRFSMLETIREFSGDMAVLEGEEEINRSALLAWSNALASSGRAANAAWLLGGDNLRELDEEIDNLRVGLRVAGERDDAESFAHIFVETMDYFYLRGLFHEDTEIGNRALALARDHPIPDHVKSGVLSTLSVLWNTLYDAESAEEFAREALLLAHRASGHPTAAIWSLNAIAMAIRDQGRYAEALEVAEEARALASETEDAFFDTFTILEVGKLAYLVDDQDRAVEYLTNALNRFLEHGGNALAFHSASLLAGAHTRRRDLPTAASTLRLSVELWRSAGNIGADGFLDEAAVLAATAGEAAISASLFGAHAAQNAYFGARGEDDYWTLEAKDAARQELGDDGYMAAEIEGRKMSMDEAIALVLQLVDWIEGPRH
ncbi:MAG: helix-turn-helix domain-containing protein [Thermomicrobiales bacterium]|nr:helix-turn-helix domain-containing protein [Thermomicrobiales bacterium]